jgi:hypothetical protein
MASSVEEEAEGEPLTPGEPGYVEALRRDLERSRPTVPQDFDLEEVYFWNHRHVPPGSVLEVISGGPEETAPSAAVALLVTSSESAEEGVWVGVTVLGAESEEVKKSLQAYFKGGRRMVHLCRIDAGGSCPVGEEEGMHLRRFRWHPPGDFRAAWLSSYALKKVRDGPKLAMETQKQAGEENKGGKKKATTSGPSETERRLSSLRARGPRVSFGEEPGSHTTSGAPAGDPGGRRVGILRRPAGSERAVVPTRALEDKVKVETVDLTTRSSRSPSRTRRGRRMESGLVEAAATYQQKQEKKDGRRRRDRSRSRRKKKRDRRKRRSSSSSRSSRSRSSSGSSSLLPPLRRKSERQPGLVFRLLEQQAYDYLAQDGVLEDRDASVDTSRRPKLFTYYQLGLKPGLDARGRDAKELGLLCRALDMLKEGRLDSLSDLLAARLMAVETSTRQGWATARHLELYDGEDEGTAPAHVLLAAQKHGKQVERAGGKGSWQRSPTWPAAWYGEGPTKGKGKEQKGKGKKGKGKGKGGKPWQTWGGDKDKKDAKAPAEAGT